MYNFDALTSTPRSYVQFAYDLQLLPKTMDYDGYESPMEKVYESCRVNGYRWRCRRTHCRKTKSARVGTWFENLNLVVKQALTFMYS